MILINGWRKWYNFKIPQKLCSMCGQNKARLIKLQGDPNQNFPFQMAITLKLSYSDPMLVKPKCVWEAAVFPNFWKFVYIFQLFVYNFSKKKLPPLKHILALPTWGQKCLVSEIEQIEKANFDLGHPVAILWKKRAEIA